MSHRVENELMSIELLTVDVGKKCFAVVVFGVNEKSCNSLGGCGILSIKYYKYNVADHGYEKKDFEWQNDQNKIILV